VDSTAVDREQIKNEHLIEKLMGEVTESNKEKETIKTEMKDLQDQIEALKKREEEANSRYESAKDALAQQLEVYTEEVARLQEIVEDDKRKLQCSEKNLKMLVLRCSKYEKRAIELIQDNTSAEVEHRDKIARICTKTDDIKKCLDTA
jgi:t-SNARE complex subunit (syntaxin)